MTLLLDILLWAGAILWALFLLMGILNALLVPNISKLKTPEPCEWPFVSILVPARNEESGIRKAVTSFCTQDYPAFEVIVVNDRSTDRTGQILAELQAQFSNLSVIDGTDPPAGWLGKPNALETARSHAKGEWFLMTDADAVHASALLRRGVAYALRENLGMLVVRPRHVTEGILEAVLMSGVNFFFFVATPLFLVRHSRCAWFATGSPVFNLFRRDALEACGGFACLKQAVVDDLEIGFHIKRMGYPVGVAFAGESIGHRMYRGARQTVQGFGKTTFPTIRKTPWILPLYFALAVVVSFLPYYGFIQGLCAGRIDVPAMASLALMHACFAGIAWRYGEPWYITFLNPLRELGWLCIFARSYVLYRRSGLVWRGRHYAPSA